MFIISDNIATTWFLVIGGGLLDFSLMGEEKMETFFIC